MRASTVAGGVILLGIGLIATWLADDDRGLRAKLDALRGKCLPRGVRKWPRGQLSHQVARHLHRRKGRNDKRRRRRFSSNRPTQHCYG